MRFCDKLAKLRKNNNMSQEQLAEAMNVSRQSISKWESGNVYPDMDKLLQLCKILDCKLDELMDDGAIKDSPKTNEKNIFKKVLNTVANIYNMFCSMTFKEKYKCIVEVLFLSFITFIIGIILHSLFTDFLYEVFKLLPFGIGTYMYRIFALGVKILIIIFGFILVYYIFKVRYLNYFKVVDDKKEIIDNTKKEYISHNTEKVVIRDPKHSSLNISLKIKNMFIAIIKVLLLIILIPAIFTLIMLSFIFIIFVSHSSYGAIFINLSILFLSLGVLNYIIIEMLLKFIFNIRQSYKRMFIMFISSLLLVGISVGLVNLNLLKYEYINENGLSNSNMNTKTVNIDFKDNIVTEILENTNDVDYVIDNSVDDIKLEITSVSGTDYKPYYSMHFSNDKVYEQLYVELNDVSFNKIYKIVLNDLKNKKIRNYNLDTAIKIKIYISEKNYETLIKNNENW